MPEKQEKQTFDQFAIVELMGHVSIAGRVREEALFGTALVRVDVPAVGKQPEYTRYFGGSAIYSVTPCTEETARAYVERRVYEPPVPYDVRRQLTAASDKEEVESDDTDPGASHAQEFYQHDIDAPY